MKILFLTAGGLSLAAGAPAFAIEQFYVDTGAGVSQMRSGANLFGSAPQVMGLGASVHLTGALNLSRPAAGAQAHLGLQYRYTTITDNSASYSLHAPYLILRLQASRLFLTLGATPFLWKSFTDAQGAGSFSNSGASLSALGEVGFDVPITPEVSLTLTAGNQLISINNRYTWAHDFTAGFRFFFGKARGRSSSGSRKMDDYPGWRYPWGMPK